MIIDHEHTFVSSAHTKFSRSQQNNARQTKQWKPKKNNNKVCIAEAEMQEYHKIRERNCSNRNNIEQIITTILEYLVLPIIEIICTPFYQGSHLVRFLFREMRIEYRPREKRFCFVLFSISSFLPLIFVTL